MIQWKDLIIESVYPRSHAEIESFNCSVKVLLHHGHCSGLVWLHVYISLKHQEKRNGRSIDNVQEFRAAPKPERLEGLKNLFFCAKFPKNSRSFYENFLFPGKIFVENSGIFLPPPRYVQPWVLGLLLSWVHRFSSLWYYHIIVPHFCELS